MKEVHLYPDGSCLGNGLPSSKGGWAVPIVINGKVIRNDLFGRLREGKQTNNRAEMEAFLQALLWIDCNQRRYAHYYIHCDSDIVLTGVEGRGRRKANRDIWIQIEYLCEKLAGKFTASYCEGHVDEFNVLADTMAKQAANSLILRPTITIIKGLEEEMAQ